MPSPVRVAIFGNGFAQRGQLPALRWAGNNEVIGIAGHSLEKARATAEHWGIPRATDDWRTLLEEDPDLVLVATPVDLHAPMVRGALDAGAAVLCEKPFALDAAEAEDLCARAEGRAAWVDHELRWNPLRRRVRELVRGGALGEVMLAQATMHIGSPVFTRRPFGWWFQAERGGGILGALGSHLVDAVRWDLGEVESVRCELRTCVKERADPAGAMHAVSADDHALLWLQMECGALAEVSTSVVRRGQHETWVEYVGSESSLRLVDDQELFAWKTGDPEPRPLPVEPGLPTADSLGMPSSGAFPRTLPLFLRDVVAAVAAGRTHVPGAATFADGLAVQRVLDAARASAAAGRAVSCR